MCPLDVAVMRGGTSRGVVLSLDAAPAEGPARDALARALVGRTPVDGLGGGTSITNKVVLVGGGSSTDADLDYIVGNVSSNGQTVDWSGTCGNMTSAVVPFACALGVGDLVPSGGPFRLRNLATDGFVEVTVSGGAGALTDQGSEVHLTTSFLDPGGAVLGQTLPTGNARDVVDVEGELLDYSLVDVTHPYLLLSYDQVVGDLNLDDASVRAWIERIRGSVCVGLGLCASPEEARTDSAAVPRAVLVHTAPDDHVDVQITAISMGQPIPTVPVTAALGLAAALGIDGTIVGGRQLSGARSVVVAGPAGSVTAQAVVGADGRVLTASVERTSRLLMRGRAWV